MLCAIDIISKNAWVTLLEDKKGFSITNTFQKFHMNLMANQTKYGKVKVANFIIDQCNHGYKIIIWKCIHYVTKENLWLLKDLLEP